MTALFFTLLFLLLLAVGTVVAGVWFRGYLEELRPTPEYVPPPPKPIPPPPTREELMQYLRNQFDDRVRLLQYLPVTPEEREQMRLDLERQFAVKAQKLFE